MNRSLPLFYRICCAFTLAAITTALYLWRKEIAPLDAKVINSNLLALLAYTLAAISITPFSTFPGKRGWLHILPAVGIAYSCVFWVAASLFITFSNSFVLVNGVLTAFFFIIETLIRRRQRPQMAFIPQGRAHNAHTLPHTNWLCLNTPKLPEKPLFSAVVADLHSQNLDASWQKFLSDCALQGIPVYNIRQIEESLTGRVKIRHLYENDLGSLLPSPAYMAVKRILDIIIVIISLPLTLPLMFLTAALVYFDNKNSVLFSQKRVGLGGREFTIFKFRSMVIDSEKNGAQLAQVGDSRITHIGKWIRKTRLDELPQLWNVLKGEMSLIGPRPEQKTFVHQFEQSIPFYNYRHIVRPGLSGWAQVTQGYAGNADETQIKIEHDFYYIKHFSFSLDVLILFKTIKTIFTGFGAR